MHAVPPGSSPSSSTVPWKAASTSVRVVMPTTSSTRTPPSRSASSYASSATMGSRPTLVSTISWRSSSTVADSRA